MKETHGACSRFMSVAVIVLMATTLAVAVVPDGNPDPAFGVGRATTGLADSTELAFAQASAIQPDGKIVAAGAVVLAGADSAFRIVRYNQDGSLDATFGIQGNITTDFSGRADVATAL